MQANPDLTVFDRNHDLNYLEHLIHLDDQQPVTATEDIYNQFGVLLIAKGSRMDRRVASQLHKHRLAQPLDQQVALQDTLSKADILSDINGMIEATEDFLEIHQAHQFEVPLKDLCLSGNLPPILRQRLTVLKFRLPDAYEHCLFSAWMCGLFGRALELNKHDMQEAFTCGLIHDLGVLHLCPSLMEEGQEMSEERWKAIQSHVLIGKLLIDELAFYSPAVSAGILEHHERMDRTGYPSRKSPEKLGLFGQIIGCADLIHKLSNNELAGQGRPLTASLSHLKVNHNAFRDDVYSAAFKVLSRVEHQTVTGPDTSLLCQRISVINETLNQLTRKLKGLHSKHIQQRQELQETSINRVASMIFKTFDSAGLERQSLQQWVDPDSDKDDRDLYRALLETDSIQYELLWLFKRLGWGFEQVLNKPGRLDDAERKAVISFTEGMEQSLQTAWGEYQL
ncbi:MAG: HD domain-containing protein [Motiliproteus sp.]|nr:HD domain-containing protein [Motiliproteus sp.]MCW9051047.1 HD domain-containing protein [Motiliproteus sp.]